MYGPSYFCNCYQNVGIILEGKLILFFFRLHQLLFLSLSVARAQIWKDYPWQYDDVQVVQKQEYPSKSEIADLLTLERYKDTQQSLDYQYQENVAPLPKEVQYEHLYQYGQEKPLKTVEEFEEKYDLHPLEQQYKEIKSETVKDQSDYQKPPHAKIETSEEKHIVQSENEDKESGDAHITWIDQSQGQKNEPSESAEDGSRTYDFAQEKGTIIGDYEYGPNSGYEDYDITQSEEHKIETSEPKIITNESADQFDNDGEAPVDTELEYEYEYGFEDEPDETEVIDLPKDEEQEYVPPEPQPETEEESVNQFDQENKEIEEEHDQSKTLENVPDIVAKPEYGYVDVDAGADAAVDELVQEEKEKETNKVNDIDLEQIQSEEKDLKSESESVDEKENKQETIETLHIDDNENDEVQRNYQFEVTTPPNAFQEGLPSVDKQEQFETMEHVDYVNKPVDEEKTESFDDNPPIYEGNEKDMPDKTEILEDTFDYSQNKNPEENDFYKQIEEMATEADITEQNQEKQEEVKEDERLNDQELQKTDSFAPKVVENEQTQTVDEPKYEIYNDPIKPVVPVLPPTEKPHLFPHTPSPNPYYQRPPTEPEESQSNDLVPVLNINDWLQMTVKPLVHNDFVAQSNDISQNTNHVMRIPHTKTKYAKGVKSAHRRYHRGDVYRPLFQYRQEEERKKKTRAVGKQVHYPQGPRHNNILRFRRMAVYRPLFQYREEQARVAKMKARRNQNSHHKQHPQKYYPE